jgi:hypothetical protein
MAVFVDARIPVVFGADPGPTDAVFAPEGGATHPAACACCVARSPDAAALDMLFLQRVRGEVAWFTRVVILQDDPALRAAIATDPVLSARFRLG